MSITAPTSIGHHRGELETRAAVLALEEVDGAWEIITDRTAFYPRNPKWPDQPSDIGVLRTAAGEFPVEGAEARRLPVAGGGTADAVGAADADEVAVVVHRVATSTPPQVGEEVTWVVDAEHRAAVSRQHTAVHVMALALNRAVAGCWTKQAPRTDGLGAPDLDSIAIASSTIGRDGGTDVYRLGKSLRKKGFDATRLPEPAALARTIEATIAGWIATDAPVTIAADGDALDGRRTWQAHLPTGLAEIPCGGSHITSLGQLGTVTITVESGDAELTIRTRASGA